MSMSESVFGIRASRVKISQDSFLARLLVSFLLKRDMHITSGRFLFLFFLFFFLYFFPCFLLQYWSTFSKAINKWVWARDQAVRSFLFCTRLIYVYVTKPMFLIFFFVRNNIRLLISLIQPPALRRPTRPMPCHMESIMIWDHRSINVDPTPTGRLGWGGGGKLVA